MKYTEKDLAKNLTQYMDFDKEIISQLKKEGNKDILDSFTKKGRAKMIAETLNYLHLLSKDLQIIVDAELKLGNKVMSAGKDYPDKDSINVTLEKRFSVKYHSEITEYTLCHDPHYWFADYSTKTEPKHLLIS